MLRKPFFSKRISVEAFRSLPRHPSLAGLCVPPPEHVADHCHQEVHPSWIGEEERLGLRGFGV